MSKSGGGCGGKILVALLVIVGLAIAASIMNKTDAAPSNLDPIKKPVEAVKPNPEAEKQKADKKLLEDAYYTGRKIIENSLKAPSTAKFSNPFTDSITGVSKDASGRYKAWGMVEAQNALGVPLRESWRTEIQEEDGKWRVVYARLGSRVLLDSRNDFPTEGLEKAKEFLGLTKEQMIAKLGEPIKQIKESSPDGSYMMYTYSEDKGKETFFTIFFSDGIISSGMYNGVSFSK